MEISMCHNKVCVKSIECIRYMGKADRVQAYEPFTPEINIYGRFKCDSYINRKNSGNPRRLTKKYTRHD